MPVTSCNVRQFRVVFSLHGVLQCKPIKRILIHLSRNPSHRHYQHQCPFSSSEIQFMATLSMAQYPAYFYEVFAVLF